MKNKKNTKIEYDREAGVLTIELQKAKSVDSDISKNVVIDYNKKGEIVRINLYDFNFETFKGDAGLFREFSRRSAVPFVTR